MANEVPAVTITVTITMTQMEVTCTDACDGFHAAALLILR